MRAVLNRTYEIDEDFSLLNMSRREFLESRFSKDLETFIKDNNIHKIDYELLCEILSKHLSINTMRHFIKKSLVFDIYAYKESNVIMCYNKTKYFILTLEELNQGVPEDGSYVTVNERCNMTFAEKEVLIVYDCHKFLFSLEDYINLVKKVAVQ